MRKLILVLVSLFLLFLVACADSEEAQPIEENESENTTEEETNNGEQNSENDLEESETKTEKEVDDEEAGEEEEEVVTAKYRVAEDWSIVPIEKSVNEKVVLLTIDDAPDKFALEMAKTLKDLDAGAIFFVNGHFIDTPDEADKLRQIHDMGFAIGNHTDTHVNLRDIENDSEQTYTEIVGLNDKIEEIIGERPKFFRAPHGINSDISKKIVEDEKMVLMNWSYGYDYFKPYFDKEKLTQAMITGEAPEVDVPYSLLKPGANLLMHDREWTNAALKDIVIGLREKGYEILHPDLIETIE